MKFCKINNIKDNTLRNLIPYLTLKKYEKGSYIFKFRQNSNSAYYLIRGKISVKTPKISNEPNNNKFSNLLLNYFSSDEKNENVSYDKYIDNNNQNNHLKENNENINTQKLGNINLNLKDNNNNEDDNLSQQQLFIQRYIEGSLNLLNDPSKKLSKIEIFFYFNILKFI
jgi:hypothetical protein